MYTNYLRLSGIQKTKKPSPCLKQSRERMVNTFLMVNITPHVKDRLDDKYMLFTRVYLK